MSAYRYEGFWKPMDTLKDKKDLNEMWNNGLAKWKIWEQTSFVIDKKTALCFLKAKGCFLVFYGIFFGYLG